MLASIVSRPEDYRWNSLVYHLQTGNEDNFLSLDFGPVKCTSLSLFELHGASLKEFGVLDAEERLKGYRHYIYEVGALDRSGKPNTGVIDNSILEKERKIDFELKRVRRFSYRSRYFTDSGIIGTKGFVSTNYTGLRIFLCRLKCVFHCI